VRRSGKIEKIRYLLAYLERIEFWIIKTQGGYSPTISLIHYAIHDIISLSESLTAEVPSTFTNPADCSELRPIFEKFTSEIRLVFADFLNPANELFMLINAARWLDIRTIMYKEGDSLSPTSFNSAMTFLFDYYLSKKPEVLIPYEQIEGGTAARTKSLWDDDDGGSPVNVDKTSKANFKEKVWQVECNMYRTHISRILGSITALSELQASNPLNLWESLNKSLPHLTEVALEILAIPAQSAGAERIFSAMNTIVTKTRCSLKQSNIGPLVESALRFKQQFVSKRQVKISEGLPPFGSFNTVLLEIDDECVSNISDEGNEEADDAAYASDLNEFFDDIPGDVSHSASYSTPQIFEEQNYMEEENV
jgi:hypothetical protein